MSIVESIVERLARNGEKPSPSRLAAAPADARLAADPPAWLRRHAKTLIVVDVLAGASATLLSQFLAFGLQHAELWVRGFKIPYLMAVFAVVPTWLAVLAAAGCYDVGPLGTPSRETRRVVNAAMHFLALMAVAYYVAHVEQLGRDFMIAIVPLATAMTLGGRAVARLGLLLQRSRGHAVRRAIVMGPRDASERLLEHLAHHPTAGITPVAALLSGDDLVLRANGSSIPVAGGPEDALALLTSTDADLLLISGGLAPGELRTLTWALEGTGVDVLVAPTMAQFTRLLDVRPIAGLPLLLVDYSSVGPRG